MSPSPNGRFDAVIFDLFGTLVETVAPMRYQAMLVAVSGALGAAHEPFTLYWRAQLEPRESGHQGGVADILRASANGVGAHPNDEAVAEAAWAWRSHAAGWLTPRGDAIALLTGLREHGLRVGLLSNCSAEVPAVWDATPFAPHFDFTGFSCALGMMKPDARVYHHLAGALGVAPGRCMFVGDGGARELTGARAVGMEAVLLRAPGEEHTWFDQHYRRDALEWDGAAVSTLTELWGQL
ncbi:MAG: HAD family hydrolase [Chloroflexota bacterium]